MSDDKFKKKRFEGLIHFREALRQSIVCLQASMGDRFAHSLQSELVRTLDESAPNASAFHLLFASQGRDLGQVDTKEQMRNHHVLARIYQQQATDLKDELHWNGQSDAQLSAWLDPSDAQATAYFTRLVSMVCNGSGPLDLKEASSWGSMIQSKAMRKPSDCAAFIEQCQIQFGFCHERKIAMLEFADRLLPLLRSTKSVHLLADGTSIGIMIEGQARVQLPHATQMFFDQLASCRAHTMAINCMSSQVQFAMFTPVRMNHANLGVPALKGLIVLHDLKRAKKLKTSKLAS